jgi:hypothetical protein
VFIKEKLQNNITRFQIKYDSLSEPVENRILSDANVKLTTRIWLNCPLYATSQGLSLSPTSLRFSLSPPTLGLPLSPTTLGLPLSPTTLGLPLSPCLQTSYPNALSIGTPTAQSVKYLTGTCVCRTYPIKPSL